MTRAMATASPAPTPRGRRSRERILEAATELFGRHGFAPVTMRAIGEAAGLDASSLYRHFPSKSALAGAVLDETAWRLLELVPPERPDAAADPAALEELAGAVAGWLFDHPARARVLLHWVASIGEAASGFDVSVPADAPDRPSGELFRRVRDRLGRAERAGAIRPLAHPDAEVALIGALLLRPATVGDLLASQEPRRSRARAREAWVRELRAFVRGAFAAR